MLPLLELKILLKDTLSSLRSESNLIEKNEGKWVHEKCKQEVNLKQKKEKHNQQEDEDMKDEDICPGCETGADYEGAHTNEDDEYLNGCYFNPMKNYCFECGEEINITKQLCGKLYCLNS